MNVVVGTVFAISTVVTACKEKTPEERGREMAQERLGVAEGAAEVLDERGTGLGEKAGRGVGKLLRGVGGGVLDAIHPDIQAEVNANARAAGISVQHANEGSVEGDVRFAQANVAFAQPFSGSLTLVALDAQGRELGVGTLAEPLTIRNPTTELVKFRFASSIRFSDTAKFELRSAGAKALEVHSESHGVRASQLRENGQVVSVYATFDEPFEGNLQLRAYAGNGEELGRSTKEGLERAADSAEHIVFEFDARTPLRDAARYELRKVQGAARTKNR